MKLVTLTLISAVALSLSACSTTELQVASADQPEMACTVESSIGSNFLQKKCRTKEQIETDRKKAEAYFATLRPVTPLKLD